MPYESQTSATLRGALAAGAAFLFWGLIPLYWKQMQGVSAFEVIAHRIVWSLFFLLGVLAMQRSLSSMRPVFTDARTFLWNLLSGTLLAVNWTVYVWGVNTGHVIETSLGYFLTPLCNVALGFVFLRERLRPLQWAAIAFAIVGVALMLLRAGHVPWIALTIAGTWSLYGILKKRSPVGSLVGLTAETLLLFPLAAALLLWRAHTGVGALGHVDLRQHVFLISTGVITAIPLLMFAYGAKRLRLATLGVLQYLSPTIQFLLGLYVYHEPFDALRFQACAFIWCGLIIYTTDSFWTQRRLLWPAVGTNPSR